MSINQREVEGQKEKKKVAEWKDASKSLDLTRSQDGTVCLPKFDSAFLVTVGITLDTR